MDRARVSEHAGASATVVALAWLVLTVVLPLAVLVAQAWPGSLAGFEREALLRALGRGLGLAVIVASVGAGVALLAARTVGPLVLLALLLVGRAITALGVLGLGLSPGPSAAVLALIVDVVPFAALIVWLRLRTRPLALIEAAADLGAGALVRAREIEWPHLRPALGAAWLWGLLQALGDVVAFELAGGGHSYTPGLLIRDALVREHAPARALVAILVILAVALPCAGLISRELTSATRSDWRPIPPPPRGLALAGWVMLAALMAGPALLLLGEQPAGFGLAERPLVGLTARSFALAGLVAALAAVAGFGLALISRRVGPARSGLLGVAVLAPLAIPPAISGLLMLGLATRLGIQPGPALTVLGLLGPGLALAYVAARLLSTRIPAALIDAARDLGASAGARLRLVWLPLGRPALAVAFMIVFAWVLAQAALPSFTSGPGGDTLAVALTIHARAGAMALVRRWSLIMIVIPVLAAMLVVVGLGRRSAGA